MFAGTGCEQRLILAREQEDSCSFSSREDGVLNLGLRANTFWDDGAPEQRARDLLQSKYRCIDDPERCQSFNYRLSWYPRASREANIQDFLETSGAPGDERPDLIQVNGGGDVFTLAAGGLARPTTLAESALCPLDKLFAADDEARLGSTPDDAPELFRAALEPSLCEDHPFAVPVGIHRINTLLFSRRALTVLVELASAGGQGFEGLRQRLQAVLDFPAGGAPPFSSPLEFQAALRSAQLLLALPDVPSARPSHLMLVGARELWPLGMFAFEFVMASRPSPLYEVVWGDQAPGPTFELGAELELWEADFASYFSGDQPLVEPSPSWVAAVEEVFRGDALVTPMGDFATTYAPDGYSALQDLIVVPFPGGGGGRASPFVYTPDSVAFGRVQGKNGFAQRRFAEVVLGSRANLLEFSRLKGAIPPFRNLDPGTELEGFLPHQVQGYLEFARAEEQAGACASAAFAQCERGLQSCEESLLDDCGDGSACPDVCACRREALACACAQREACLSCPSEACGLEGGEGCVGSEASCNLDAGVLASVSCDDYDVTEGECARCESMSSSWVAACARELGCEEKQAECLRQAPPSSATCGQRFRECAAAAACEVRLLVATSGRLAPAAAIPPSECMGEFLEYVSALAGGQFLCGLVGRAEPPSVCSSHYVRPNLGTPPGGRGSFEACSANIESMQSCAREEAGARAALDLKNALVGMASRRPKSVCVVKRSL